MIKIELIKNYLGTNLMFYHEQHAANCSDYGIIKAISQRPYGKEEVVMVTLSCVKTGYKRTAPLKNMKPILRPLSDLKKDRFKQMVQDLYEVDIEFAEYHSGNTEKEDFTFTITYKLTGDVFTDIIVNRGSVDGTRYKIVKLLFENHFDVFGLIGQDLAIDINTLKV